jgi:hypothetical protein
VVNLEEVHVTNGTAVRKPLVVMGLGLLQFRS